MKNGMHKGYGTSEALEQHLGYWDDIRFPSSAVRLSGSQPPTAVAYKGGLVLSFSSVSDKTIYFNAQMPHGYETSDDLDFHLHYVLPSAGGAGGAENMKFDMTYAWADINGAIPAETTLTATMDVQNQAADTHYLFDMGAVLTSNRGAATPAGGVSSMLICSLTRDVSVASDYSSNIYLMESDFHYRFNSPGSREEYLK